MVMRLGSEMEYLSAWYSDSMLEYWSVFELVFQSAFVLELLSVLRMVNLLASPLECWSAWSLACLLVSESE